MAEGEEGEKCRYEGVNRERERKRERERERDRQRERERGKIEGKKRENMGKKKHNSVLKVFIFKTLCTP